MRGEQDEAFIRRRLEELAQRCDRQGMVCFSDFLSPPEAEWARQYGKKNGVTVTLNGGYEEAERRVARFSPDDGDQPFPITALALTWPRQDAPAHRDILGSVMGLGIMRHCVGDIVLEAERAILFAETVMAGHIKDNLLSAGKARLQVEALDALPALQTAEGQAVRDTVASSRLDAVVAAGFDLSRAKAAALIAAGQVKLKHIPIQRPDAMVGEQDTISVRGYGRLRVEAIGQPTRKGRCPIEMLRYGEKHS